jgi:hypothetical protein
MTDLPIACALDPISLEARRDSLLPVLVREAAARTALPKGLRLTFTPTPEIPMAIARVIEAERHCCRFLRFQVTVEPAEGPIVLEVTGPPGTGAFLQQLLVPA